MKPRFRSSYIFALLLFVLQASWATRTDAQSAPVITVAPVDITRIWQGSGVFSVTATAAAPLSYQWYRGESGNTASPIPGATGPLLVTQALAATTRFWVRVASTGLSVDSPAATVTVSGVPSQPLALGAMGYNYYGQLGDGSTTSRSTPIAIATGVASVSTGDFHTLFMKTDGSLWAMGYNGSGALGDGSTTNRSTPVPVATGVASVSAGAYYTLFVKTDGSLWAMGGNGAGQLGDGSTTYRSIPIQVATGVASVSAGDSHTLFVKTDGSLWAMGDNLYGQLGDGSTYSGRNTPVQVATSVASVSAGYDHTLFVKTDGSLWAMGDNSTGQLGDGSTSSRSTPVQVADGVASVSAGGSPFGSHTLFVKTDGSLWAMGYNAYGQLGDGSNTNRRTPVQVVTGVASVSAGDSQTLFVKTDGSLWAMGANFYGQLGDGSTENNRRTPVQAATGVASVSTSDYFTHFIGTSQTVTFALGTHATRIGSGALVQTIVSGGTAVAPTLNVAPGWAFIGWDVIFSNVTADLTVTAQYVVPTPPVLSAPPSPRIAAWQSSTTLTVTASANAPLTYQWYRGESGDVASPVPGATGPLLVTPSLTATTRFWVQVTNAGLTVDSPAVNVTVTGIPSQPLALAAMGDNGGGQLGGGSATLNRNPFQVTTDVASVSTSSGPNAAGLNAQTLFVKTDHSLWAMGDNRTGQLGDGSNTNRSTPVQVAVGVASVSTGGWQFGGAHTLFVKTDGSLWAMGSNLYGQLGDGFSSPPRSTPVQIATGVASVSAGSSHTLFVKTDGSLWAMGENRYGQLGDGSTAFYRTTPVQVATGVASVSAGYEHTLFVKADGSLWAMGNNSYGQLGDGSSTPVQVATGVASVSADGSPFSGSHTLFVKTDGSLWAVGANFYGQLGDGSTTYRSTPVQVATAVASVSAGLEHTLFVKTDGSLWAMGHNYYGQLGDGSSTQRNTPVQVATAVTSVSAGGFYTLFLGTSQTVTFALGSHATRSGDGALAQTVMSGTAATAPTLSVAPGWVFTGWDLAFTNVTTDLLVTAQYQTTFAAWAATTGLSGPAAAPSADPDTDGLPNLLEYLFGTSPTLADSGAFTRPSVTLGTVSSQPALILTHRRRKAALVSTVYQQTINLGDPAAWTPVAVTPTVVNPDADADGLTELVSVAVPVPAGADTSLFLRLSVSE